MNNAFVAAPLPLPSSPIFNMHQVTSEGSEQECYRPAGPVGRSKHRPGLAKTPENCRAFTEMQSWQECYCQIHKAVTRNLGFSQRLWRNVKYITSTRSQNPNADTHTGINGGLFLSHVWFTPATGPLISQKRLQNDWILKRRTHLEVKCGGKSPFQMVHSI